MVKWLKITENQYLGFWILGLVLFAIQEIPYMVMPFLHLETNPIMEMPNKSMLLNICEKVLGSACIAVMVLIVHSNVKLFSVATRQETLFFGAALAIIIVNFIGWGLYFSGLQSMMIIIGFLVALPPLYYIFIGLWRGNYALVILGSLFLITHIANVWNNLH